MGLGDCQAGSLLCFEHAASSAGSVICFLDAGTCPALAVMLWDNRAMRDLARGHQFTPNTPTQHSSICTTTEARKQLCRASWAQFPASNKEMTGPGLKKDEQRGTRQHRDPLPSPLLEPGVVRQHGAWVPEHWCWSIGASASPSAPPLLPADGLGTRLSRAGREEGVGRELLIEHAGKAGDPADTVCFLLCHFSARTHTHTYIYTTEGKGREGKEKKKAGTFGKLARVWLC